jgi:two-component system LytT family response regulator
MISCALIDDEPLVIKNLETLLKKYCPQIRVSGTADSAVSGKRLIESLKPQLVFLDIEMPYGNGFDLLKSFPAGSFNVIFVTAFDSYAVRAIKHSAIDYILKPIDKEELKASVQKAEEIIIQRKESLGLDNLIANIKTLQSDSKRIALPTLDGLVFVDTENIIYCQSGGNYTNFYFKDGSNYLVSRQINEYNRILPAESFFRIHNEYIVNIKTIKKYIKGRGGSVILENGKSIAVSARKKEDFLKRVMDS